jgi:hypothetical protein
LRNPENPVEAPVLAPGPARLKQPCQRGVVQTLRSPTAIQM